MSATSDSSTSSTSAAVTCATVNPDQYGSVPHDACNSYYTYDPIFPANLAFAVVFGLSTIIHIVQAIGFKKVGAL